ncbi:hypothetical protein [Lactiplantibacillus plantarum]|uniref:hypothetical protein n=1 Tax=Lactiplantibacillus plantarum TaxID=1590 RepID=UPI0022E5AA0D|nr:hypothetical protein [Lactiplantibacillus plantarum]
MVKMINTKYGYVTPQEAEMDAHLDKWMKRRASKHGTFSLDKIKPENSCRNGFKV